MTRRRRPLQPTEPTNLSAFRVEERRYKQRQPPPSYEQCIDAHANGLESDRLTLLHEATEGWRIFGVNDLPGWFKPAEHRFWVWECMRVALAGKDGVDGAARSVTNLDAHYSLPDVGLLEAWIQERQNGKVLMSRLHSTSPRVLSDIYINTDESQQEMNEASPSIQSPSEPDPSLIRPSTLIRKLRWANLGLQYNWHIKQYILPTTSEQAVFPPLLQNLARQIVRLVSPWIQYRVGARGAGADMEGDDPDIYCKRRKQALASDFVSASSPNRTAQENSHMTAVTESIPCPIASLPLKQGYDRPFVPQAGIINVYQLKDALTAHVDRAEQNMEAPLVSLSFGHACVFLIGGVTRDIRPTAILLRSGDAVVLSGESRRAFHGVPRIIEDSLPSWFRQDITTQDCKTACDENDGLTEDQRALVYDFIQTARVNVNMRQVMLMTDLCGQ